MRRDLKAEFVGDGKPSAIPTITLLLIAMIIAFASPHRETASTTKSSDSPDDQSRYDSGWKDILWRTYTQIGEDRLLAVAAGVVFYGLLALFPAITALVSSYALFADPKSINDHLAFLADTLPAGTYSIVHDQIERVLAKGDVKLGIAFLASLLLAVWSANGGMKAIIDALNVVYDENEKRGFVNAVSLSFTLQPVGRAGGDRTGRSCTYRPSSDRLGIARRNSSQIWAVAGARRNGTDRIGDPLSVCPQSEVPEMEMDFGRQRGRRRGVANGTLSALLLSRKFRWL
jgi:hypothetical protein